MRLMGNEASGVKAAMQTQTANCANNDLACRSGVGVQQNAPLTQQTREAIADGASTLSRQAGVVAAGATAATQAVSPQFKPIPSAVAVGATVIGVGADVVEQVVRPDLGQTVVNGSGIFLQRLVESTPTGRLTLPITNEVIEMWRASRSSLSIQDWINAQTRRSGQ